MDEGATFGGDYDMHIAVDMHFLQDKHQGIKTCLSGLYRALCQRDSGHNYTFIFLEPDNVSDDWAERGQVVFTGRAGRGRRLSYAMARTIRKLRNVDLSHFSAVIPAWVPGRVMVTVHDILFLTHPQFFRTSYRWQQRVALMWTLKRADIVTTVSNYTYDSVKARFPGLAAPVAVLPNGVDGEVLDLDEVEAREYVKRRYGLEHYIMTVGRIDRRKNHEGMLDAFRRLAGAASTTQLPTFLVVGEVDNKYLRGERAIRRASRELPVRWLRDVDDLGLRMLYAAALCVVFASHGEGFGMPILEAMAAGAPVIASKNTATAEVLEDAGIIVNPERPACIADAMGRILRDAQLRQRCVTRGRAIAAKKTWEHSAEKYIRMLEEM